MRRADKEFLKSQIENLKESAHERFETVLMQIDYLNLKLFRAEKGCKKLREENRRLRAENQMLEDNMGNLLCTREEEMKYNRVLNENITKLAEVNALMAGKLSVYEPIKKLNLSPMRRLTQQESQIRQKNNQGNSLATCKIQFFNQEIKQFPYSKIKIKKQ